MNLRCSVLGAGVLVAAAAAASEPPVAAFGPLAAEDSGYLRRQAASAVEWRPWGPDAFAEAERTGRPLFVSIGYFTCRWTSKMDREAFDDPAMAALLNTGCVNVKIDRFERPDLDRMYMRYVEASGQRAGWPLNLWLTPDRHPLRAATSLTASDEGQGSLALETRHVLRHWESEATHLRTQARIDLQQLADRIGPQLAGPLEIDERLIEAAHRQILGQFDPEHGGFSRAPKFPSPARLGVLIRRAARSPVDAVGADDTVDVVHTTLDRMARAGLRDPLGGGFFRYALDEGWRRPYFEKLALDQAQHAESYLLGHRLTGHGEWAAVARETLEYAWRELGHPEGGFYNGEHGESRPQPGDAPQEGAFYAWTHEEVRRHAGPSAAVMESAFDIRRQGNLPPGCDPLAAMAGANLLSHLRPLPMVASRLGLPIAEVETAFHHGSASLLAARSRRPRPPLDRLLITQMNAALVSSFCQAALLLDEPVFLDRARRTAEFIHDSLWDARSGTLFRCRLDRAPRHFAVADDYAALVRALLDLHESTGEIRWLRWAFDVQAAFDRHHADPAGGYVDARHSSPDIPLPLKSIDDASGISPNAVAGLNLVRWSILLDDPARAGDARCLLGAFATPLRAGSGSVAGLFQVADALVHPSRRVILFGQADDPAVRAARVRVARAPVGRWHLLNIENADARLWLSERGALPPALAAHPLDSPTIFVADAGGEMRPLPVTELDKSVRTFR